MLGPSELWTPPGVTKLAPTIGGHLDTGEVTVTHTFRFHSAKYGRICTVKIPTDASMSRAHIEDLAANALESWLVELEERAQQKAGKHTPSPEERKEVGKAIREFREYAAKRRASSTGKLFYPVAKPGAQ